MVSPDGEIAVVTAESAYADNDPRSADLVRDLRSEVPDGVEVTGNLALFTDIADLLATRLWLVIGFVVLISVVLLTMMFRSIAVPLKAAVMNLLSVGAAYGVLTAVFQWGWGLQLLGIDHSRPVSLVAADPDVHHPVRALHGLRGVPALAGQGGLRPDA